MKTFLPLLFVAGLLLSGCGSSYGDKEAPAEETAASKLVVGEDKVARNAEGKAVCPVMNVVIDGNEADYVSREYNGVKYIMCCKSCPTQFDKDPAKYAVKN